MEPQQPKHVSPWIAWSLVVLFAGIAAFTAWYYYDQVSSAYDSQTFFGVKVHKKATTTTPTTTTTTKTTTSDQATINKTICNTLYPNNTYVLETGVSQLSNGTNFCVVKAQSGNFARGLEGGVVANGSGTVGANWLAAKVNNVWTVIQQTQEGWICSTLTQYNFPASLLGSDKSCIVNTSTGQTQTYQ